MRTIRRALILLVILLTPTQVIPQAPIDATVRGGFVVPEFDSQNRRRSVLFGEEAIYVSNRIYLINGLKIETYNQEEKLAWTILAPKCYFNYNNKTAYSDSSLEAVSADDQFFISGEGFEWRQSDSSLTISNKVLTRIKLISKQTNAPKAMVRQEFEIKAGKFNFKPRSNEAIYSKGVELNENPLRQGQTTLMKLKCEELIAKFLEKGGGVETINAKYNVNIQQGTNSATAFSAFYYSTNDQIHLIGSPKWFTPEAEGSADIIILDRKNDEFIAIGHTFTRARGGAGGAFGLELFETNKTSKTNLEIEIFSEKLAVKLPAQGKQIQRLNAEGGVRIVQGDSFIQSEKAAFNSSTNEAFFNFYNNVDWHSKGLSGKTDFLSIDRLKNSFRGKGNSYIAAERIQKEGENSVQTNAPEMEIYSDEFLFQNHKVDFSGKVRLIDRAFVIESEELTMQMSPTNRLQSLIAKRNVIAKQNSSNPVTLTNGFWKLECDFLETQMDKNGINPQKIITLGNVRAVHYSKQDKFAPYENLSIICKGAEFLFKENTNALQSVVASNDVFLAQRKMSTNGVIYTNLTLRCNILEAGFRDNGRYISSARAIDDVFIEQPTAPSKSSPPLRLKARMARLQTFQHTNLVDFIEATNNVVIEYGKTFALAQAAFFTATNEVVKLNGNPILNFEMDSKKSTNQSPRRIEVSSADSLLWYRGQNRFQALGQYEVKILLDETSKTKFGIFNSKSEK